MPAGSWARLLPQGAPQVFIETVTEALSKQVWKAEYERKKREFEKLSNIINPGSCVYVESGCGEPQHLVRHIIFGNKDLCDIQIFTSVPLRTYSDFGGDYGSRFRIKSFFISPSMSTAFAEGQADHLPLSTMGMHKLFSEGYIKINTALIQLSPPDSKGRMSLGVMVDITRSIIQTADVVIAQVNRNMPVTRGDSMISLDDVDYLVEYDEPLVSYHLEDPDPETKQVGLNIARLIEDGSTIQMGFGRIPDAAMMFLKDKHNLCIHSEIITDTIADLAASGAISCNPLKPSGKKITASLCIGSKRIFDYVNDNPMVKMQDISQISDPSSILHLEKFIAVNGAVEIDITGQSCVGMGEQMGYFGALGHAVFNRTAMFTPGGKGIIALRSTSRDGKFSRIVPEFTNSKIGIITTQADINYVVTEFGSVNLFGKSIRERALALITIAHPKFRQWLLDEAKRMNYVYQDQVLPPENFEYPLSFEKNCTFKDHPVLIRPIKVTDERAVQNLFYSLSKDDRFQRFLMHVNSLHHKQAQDLVTVDYKNSIALVVQNGSLEQDRILAVAHIALEEDPGIRKVCEFAAMVDPAWQNRGVGSYLLKNMLAISKELGFERMRAYVWEDNAQMLKAFEKLGCGMTQELDCHVYRINIDI